jgi:Capsular polysaccharide synthesis protein
MWQWVVLILTFIVLILVINRSISSFQGEIPKTIWTYWDDPNVPPLTQKCMENWKRMCPEYDIRLLNKADVPDEYKHLTPERQSDWLRLDRIKRYGGVWLDASVILTESLDWVQGSGEALMFYQEAMAKDTSQRMYESWFIASVPNGAFITALFDEFDFACKTFGNDGDKYIEHLRKTHGNEKVEDILQNIFRGLIGYLTIYVAIQKVLKIDGIDRNLITGIPGESGPIMYQTKHKWNHEAVVNDLLGPWPAEGVNKLVKLVREDRKHLQKRDWMNPHPDSIFAKFLI